MARRAYLDDEGRLQIRLQTNPSQSSHSHEVLHEYRRPAVSGAEDDVLVERQTHREWSDVSEMITDLANDLVRRDDWDPSVYHSPHQHLLDTEGAVDNDKGSVDK
ncbi:hypothetical protein MHU86_2964 [Fragilaria crotonensis]|nr:hypothetical protein MHU86_2964 [Fragilaria crotonensis]